MERTKAIVKFFSQEPIENVMVMMKYMPERVIFLGHKDNMITKQIRDIEQFRDHNIQMWNWNLLRYQRMISITL